MDFISTDLIGPVDVTTKGNQYALTVISSSLLLPYWHRASIQQESLPSLLVTHKFPGLLRLQAKPCNVTISDIHPSDMWVTSRAFPDSAFQFDIWGTARSNALRDAAYKMAISMKVALCDNCMGLGLVSFLAHNLFIGNVILPSDALYHPLGNPHQRYSIA